MRERKEKRQLAVNLVVTALCAAVFELFLLFDLFLVRESWGETYFLLAAIGGSVLNVALLFAAFLFRLFGKELAFKCCVTVYAFAVICAVMLYILLRTGFFAIVKDEEAFEAYLKRSGSWMSVVFIVIQFLQVVILPIPSTVTVVAGAALFNPLRGSIFSLIGIMLGSLCAFLIGRYAGARAVAWLVGKDTLEKWMKKIEGKDKLLLTAMFVLPVFPDDVLCFVAGLSSMSVWYFLTVIFISRVLAVFITSYSITLIPFDTWWGLLIWGIFGLLVIALFIFLYRKSDAILGWFERTFHRETRISEEKKGDEFTVEIVDPDGSVVEKGVKKEGTDPPKQPPPTA